MSDGGKGSKPRPFSVSQDQFAQNWNAIFGKKHEEDDSNKTDQTDQSFEPGGLGVSGLQTNANS